MVEYDDSATGSGAAGSDRSEQMANESDTISDGWERTLEDTKAMAADRREKGFDVVTIPSGDTTALSPDAGDTDRWGLTHLIPGNKVDEFEAIFEGGEFTETGVYQMTDSGHVFVVTECIDLDAKAVVFIAGAYQMRHATALVRAATEREKMYSHVRTLDRTYLGTFEHDDVSAFFPDPDQFYAYESAR